jgi:hypothetical protein
MRTSVKTGNKPEFQWRRRGLLWGALALASATGCDSDSTSGPVPDAVSCELATACGGDVQGTWSLKELCTPYLSGDGFCREAITDARAASTDVVLTFDPNSTFTATQTMAGRLVIDFPPSCQPIGGAFSCQQLASLFLVSSRGELASADCVSQSDGVCHCDLDLRGARDEASGTYSVDGGTIHMKTAGAHSASATKFCVAGGELAMWTQDPPASSPSMASARRFLILKKR